jgi:primary-amine oxidase
MFTAPGALGVRPLMLSDQGLAVRDMLPGYDCPYDAVYLPATTYSTLGMINRERAICIFEHDTARPITRHTGWNEGEFGAVKGYVLTVRSISTVGKCVSLSHLVYVII